ncbi:MAG: AI-2E family transporter [Holophagae bacterium]|nr:MAG: AI-2E family transporter [Holophagae bacterium]
MSEVRSDVLSPEATRRAIELTVRLVLVGLLAYWCFRIFRPFLMPLIWGIVLAVALAPIYLWLEGVLRGRRKLAATLLVVVCLGLLIAPAVALSDSVIDGARFISTKLEQGQQGELRIPPAPAAVADWPVIGDNIYETWNAAATSLETVLKPFHSQLLAFGGWLITLAKQAALAVIMTAVSLVIAAVLLVRRESAIKAALAIGGRLGGEHGTESVRLAGRAIGTVAKGVVGVAAIQAALAAIGLVAAGVPGAGLWALLVLVLAVAQLPPILVLGPAILYVVASGAGTATVVLFTIWSLLASFSDAILKPLLLGRGIELPVGVILIGAIGGLILHGLIGLFIGAIVFSIGYRLWGAWMAQAPPTAAAAPVQKG